MSDEYGIKPFVVCQDGTLVYGDLEAAKAAGLSEVTAYVIEVDPKDPAGRQKMMDLRRQLIVDHGPDDGSGLRMMDGETFRAMGPWN